jgi:hypothetical protein
MPLRPRLGVALALTVSVAGAIGEVREHPSLVPGSPTASGALERLESWATAVDAHRPGKMDEPARLVAACMSQRASSSMAA